MSESKLPHLEMIEVAGGVFTMGDDKGEYDDEKPAHQVEVASFKIGKYPVTQAHWKAVMGAENNPSRFQGDNRPVEQVSWDDTQVFLEKLRKMTGKPYRLLTEAEWEYAAWGGQESQGYPYAGGHKLKDVGWYAENSYGETKPVGRKYPNELGIYDMSSNVWEWVEDQEGADRVCRGGSWNNPAAGCRVAIRYRGEPRIRLGDLGFRLGLSLQVRPVKER